MIKDLLFPDNVCKRHAVFLFIFLLNYYRCFNCIIYNIPIFKYGAYVIEIIFSFHFILCALKCSKRRNSIFEKSIDYVYLMIFIALVIGHFDGQNFTYAIKWVSRTWLLWGVYYYLKYHNLPIDYIFGLIKFLLIGSVAATLISTVQFPNSWFGMSGEDALQGMKDSLSQRGVMRFNVPGKILIVLFIFKEIQNFTFSSRILLRLAMMTIFLVMIGNRFPMAVCLCMLLVLVFISKTIKFKHKIQVLLSVGIIGIAVFYIPFTKDIIDKLLALNDAAGANGLGDENIRVLSSTYFFTEFNSPNDYYHILLGNGMAFPNSGGFSDKIYELSEMYGYYASDVGYAALYLFFGIIGLLIFLIWLFSSLFVKVSNEYAYIKWFFFFLAISMICGGYWFEYFVEVAMLSYILVVSNNKDICLART